MNFVCKFIIVTTNTSTWDNRKEEFLSLDPSRSNAMAFVIHCSSTFLFLEPWTPENNFKLRGMGTGDGVAPHSRHLEQLSFVREWIILTMTEQYCIIYYCRSFGNNINRWVRKCIFNLVPVKGNSRIVRCANWFFLSSSKLSRGVLHHPSLPPLYIHD